MTKARELAASFPERKNLLVNATFESWQRGHTFLPPTGLYADTADKWKVGGGGTGSITTQRYAVLTTDLEYEGRYGMQISQSSTVTGVTLRQNIESFLAENMKSKEVTVTIHCNATNVGTTPQVTISSFDTEDNDSAVTQVDQQSMAAIPNDQWTTQSVTLTMDDTLGRGCQLDIDFGDRSNNALYIAWVQLEVGSIATPLERLDYPTMLAQCQRYIWAIENDTSLYTKIGNGRWTSASIARIQIPLPVEMRKVQPSISFTSGQQVINNLGGLGVVQTSSVAVSNDHFQGNLVEIQVSYATGGQTAGQGTSLWLQPNATTYRFLVDADI